MSSPEELTFVGRWLRPLALVLHLVRRMGLVPTSSREQGGTGTGR